MSNWWELLRQLLIYKHREKARKFWHLNRMCLCCAVTLTQSFVNSSGKIWVIQPIRAHEPKSSSKKFGRTKRALRLFTLWKNITSLQLMCTSQFHLQLRRPHSFINLYNALSLLCVCMECNHSNPFRTKTPNIYSQEDINLYCIIKLAT